MININQKNASENFKEEKDYLLNQSWIYATRAIRIKDFHKRNKLSKNLITLLNILKPSHSFLISNR